MNDMRPVRRWLLRCASLLAVALLCACAGLPPLEGRTESTALQDTAGTRLGQAVQPLLQAHAGLSGIVPLPNGHDAFAARATLAEAAQRTLDVQYYIWRRDVTGSLLLAAVQRAAERGVRVRMLLDDNGSAGMDDVLTMLDAHPNIEVRLFNPYRRRSFRSLDYVADFDRINRRMHNKSFTADNKVTVVGGRNVGDEYYAAGADVLFIDLDVLAIGPVVADVSNSFDSYWSSASAYPIDRLAGPAPAGGAQVPIEPPDVEAAGVYRQAIARSSFVRDLMARQLAFEWARTTLVSDDPGKGLGQAGPDDHVWARLRKTLPEPQRELVLVSPYFVPAEEGTAYFSALPPRNVHVTVVTNALEATDVPAVHSGYARWREPLLQAGVDLWELRRGAAPAARPPEREGGPGGSSGSSLHAKTLIADRQRVFVGSANFDPRSALINTEMGFVIESPALASTFADKLAERLPGLAYHVKRSDAGLEWTAQEASGPTVYRKEPNAGMWRRFQVWFLGLLPIESML